MQQSVNAAWHFPIMILVSFILFFVVLRIVLGRQKFINKKNSIIFLSLIVVIGGMLFGKYGANMGLKWWIYYPVPMLMNVLLPPAILKMNSKKTILYLVLSILSAPVIHILFSFFLGWTEYIPFWRIPYIKSLA